ncbi:MAG: hypothetical protein HC845_07220 [Akkermansiaceae bacterium]|nr:hypothetical protein [Akkermansiaceae bacterium]
MKRKTAWLLAIFSAVYLLTIGLIPDPIPFIDEGIALLIFVQATRYLGYDVTKWLSFFGKGKPSPSPARTKQTIDV